MLPRKKRQNAPRIAPLVAEVEMVGPRIIEVHSPLDQAKSQRARIELEVARGSAGDGRDVVDARHVVLAFLARVQLNGRRAPQLARRPRLACRLPCARSTLARTTTPAGLSHGCQASERGVPGHQSARRKAGIAFPQPDAVPTGEDYVSQ